MDTVNSTQLPDFANLTINISSSGEVVWTEPHVTVAIPLAAVQCILYSLVFFLSIVGNISVLCVIQKNRRFHSATYMFIGNLAVADLLMAIFCLPITLFTNIYSEWVFGPFVCKTVPYLQGVSVCASVNTLVVIAVDRYIAICHVMRQRNTKRTARIIILIIWIISSLIIMPWAVFYKYHIYVDQEKGKSSVYCIEEFPNFEIQKGFFVGVIFLMLYCVPMALIAVFYFLIGYRVWNRDAPGITSSKGVIEKSKVKVVKMLAVVVLLFMISWMPLYIIKLKSLYVPDVDSQTFVNKYINPFAQWLGTSNSCMNPLVYCLFSQKIRRRIRAMLCCQKQEARTLYSNRSTYNSALQHSMSTRDSSLRFEPCVNGHGGGGGLVGGVGSIYGQHQDSVCYHHRHPRQSSDFIQLKRNSTMSTHV